MAMTEATDRTGHSRHGANWHRATLGEVLRQPLPHLGLFDRCLTRAVGHVAASRFAGIDGLDHVASASDPFILALNHTTRFEAVAIPALLMFYRGGRRVHFFADWNFQMVPGIGLLYRRSGAIVVTRKRAKPAFLNALKPLYAHAEPANARAGGHLLAGRSVGVFVEGTVNRDPGRLLRGRLGVARLSLTTGLPVVPGGIRFSGGTPSRPLLSLCFGAPLRPPCAAARPDDASNIDSATVRAWHSTIMTEIARLSGKAWEPMSEDHRHGTP